MGSPRIGIPLCLDTTERIRRGRRYHYIDETYAIALREAQAIPIYLPMQEDPRAALMGCDGLLLPGGDDFLPGSPYPADIHFDPVPRETREFDEGLLRSALSQKLPILGICYGMQLIALSMGGQLHHHLPHDRPDAGEHQLGEGANRHEVRVEPDSLLARWMSGSTPVNSLHHQALADPGPNLRVSARAEDGVIEAIEGCEPGFLVGVQWHPDKLPSAEREPLFRAFANACRSRS